MGDPRIDSMHDPYEDQLSAARYKAERDQLRQELHDLREWAEELEWSRLYSFGHLEEATAKAKRLGKLVWRLQNRLARAHRRERNLRKGMRMWREKAISGPVRTVSAYDLLPEEDLQALRWVREHGGLDIVKKLLDWMVGHCSTKQQLDFDFWLSGRVMYELGFDEDMADRDEVERRLLARLMPEGYEWPRYESGEPLRYEDRYVCDGREREVWHVDFDSYGEPTILNKDGTRCHPDKGERVKLVIGAIEDGGRTVTCRYADQSIEEDAKSVAKLFDNLDADASEDIREIVRRCRALAERERGE